MNLMYNDYIIYNIYIGGVFMNLNSSNIKLLMAEQELNIGLLAERMDMSRQWVSSNLQRGYSNTKFINKLAEALEVEIKEIVKLED